MQMIRTLVAAAALATAGGAAFAQTTDTSALSGSLSTVAGGSASTNTPGPSGGATLAVSHAQNNSTASAAQVTAVGADSATTSAASAVPTPRSA